MTKTALPYSWDFSINQVGAVPLRQIAKFVKTANQFSANVVVRCDGSHANGKNLFEVAELPLRGQRIVTVSAWGLDAQECVETLGQIVDDWASLKELEMCP